MKTLRFLLALSALLAWMLVGWAATTSTQAGPYRITLSSKPAVIPVGQASLYIRVADSGGNPVEGAKVVAIAKMPGMDMGEREQTAQPVPGQPGVYGMKAAFPMAGGYEVTIKVDGRHGPSTAKLSVQTGQDLGESTSNGFNYLVLLPWILGVALLIFTAVRMKRTGGKLEWRKAFNRTTLGGLALLAAMLAIAVYAVNTQRRPGSMTPLEAQGMEMNTPAPPGTLAVEVAQVKRGPVHETLRYSGQAVGYTVQDVNPRGTGVVIWMPYYVGDRVKQGQILARLDTSQLDPQLAERAAMANMAGQAAKVAATEYETALQEVAQMRAELSAKQGAVDEAEAMLDAAKQDREAMKAEVAVMQSEVESAMAEVSSARAEELFRNDELARSQQLYGKGALSRSELQEAQSAAAKAMTELHHAQAMVVQARARVSAAQANVRRGDAMVSAAERRVRQAQADVRAGQAAVRAKQSAAEGAKGNIAKERAGVAQARAGYASASAQREYAALRSEVEGVVTERLVGPGTLVNPGQTVLRVAQVSPIRVQANIPLVDLEKVRVGQRARIFLTSGSKPVAGQVRSVSPAIDPASRTGVVEVVLPNQDRRVLPGQFVTMEIQVGGESDGLAVPLSAVQRPPSVSGEDKAFVWVAEPTAENRYSVRQVTVQTGMSDGRQVQILEGLAQGQLVVTTGADSVRQGIEVTAELPKVASAGPVIEVTAAGFRPATLDVRNGEPVTLTFIRRSEEGCGKDVMFPELGIRKDLPLNEPVEIKLTPTKPGVLRFACGMDMLKGTLVVK